MFKKIALASVFLSNTLASAQILGVVGDYSSAKDRMIKEAEIKSKTDALLEKRANFVVDNKESSDNAALVDLPKLSQITIESPILKDEMFASLSQFIGKPLPPDTLVYFVDRFIERGKKKGYVLSLNFESNPDDGSLKVIGHIPTLTKALWVSSDKPLLQRYEETLRKRFDGLFVAGQPLDVLNLEQKIESIMLETPLDIRAFVKPLGNGQAEVLLDIKEISNNFGRLERAFIGASNHSLPVFGEFHGRAGMQFTGPNPGSRISIMGQKSAGADMFSVFYKTPISGVGQLLVDFSQFSSQPKKVVDSSILSKTKQVNVKLDRALAVYGHYMLTGTVGVSSRTTDSTLILDDTPLNHVTDDQKKVGLYISDEGFSSEPDSASLSYIEGKFNSITGRFDYSKVEFDASSSRFIGAEEDWLLTGRVRGQYSNSQLDSFNQIGLGGPFSVRAYNANDAWGKSGVIATVELNRRINKDLSIGAFYDEGWAKADCSCGKYTYRLKAVGVQANGKLAENFSYNVTLAKGIGGYPNYVSGRDSEPNQTKLWFQLTYNFK